MGTLTRQKSVEFWNRWFRVSWYYNWLYSSCQLDTHVTSIVYW